MFSSSRSSSPTGSTTKKKRPEVYYSARGGPRSKGADVTARNNASSPPSATLETPLPRSSVSHYNRGGEGNEWEYAAKSGTLETQLALDQMRALELRQGIHNRPAVAGLRGGARIPKPKDPSAPKKKKHLSLFRRRAASLTSSDQDALDDFSLYDDDNSLRQRGYQSSLISSDGSQSARLSNFTVPSFLRGREDSVSLICSSTESLTLDAENQRIRSFSLSSRASEDSVHTPESSPLEPHTRFSLVSPGVLFFKPNETQPLAFEDIEGQDLAEEPPGIASR